MNTGTYMHLHRYLLTTCAYVHRYLYALTYTGISSLIYLPLVGGVRLQAGLRQRSVLLRLMASQLRLR